MLKYVKRTKKIILKRLPYRWLEKNALARYESGNAGQYLTALRSSMHGLVISIWASITF